MSSNVGVNRLIEALHEKIGYFRKEYTLNYAEAIGALRILARELEDEMLDVEEESGGEADGG